MRAGLALVVLAAAVLAPAAPPEPVPAVPLPRAELVARALQTGETVWREVQNPAKYDPRSADLLLYALVLCEAGRHPERLELLIDLAARMQIRDPQDPQYGDFRWVWNDPGVRDRNATEFAMQPAAVLWLRHRDALPAAARARLREMLDPGVIASVRHRVSDGYTNIAIISASNLIMLGEGMDRPEIAAEGYGRLQAFFDLTSRSGIREYVSADYYGPDLDALLLIATLAQRPAGRRQAQALFDLVWHEVAANFWWPARRLGGAHSRSYNYLHNRGEMDGNLWAAGYIDGFTDSYLHIGLYTIIPALCGWQPPADLAEMSQTKLPRLVRQMWGADPVPAESQTPGSPVRPAAADGGVWAGFTHWLGKDVTLSVAGANYGNTDIPLAVDFPGPRDSVRCYFIPDGRNDPYGKMKIMWRGHPKCVHLTPFFAGVQDRQDALALVVYREQDVPADTPLLQSHFVMPRAVDAIFVGEQEVAFAANAPRNIPLAAGEPVFLRQGTAVLAVRVPAARTRAGEAAPAALVWDVNDWGAIRLTIDHEATREPPKVAAAAALQIRVGSGLDDAAFAEFRRTFAAAKCAVVFEPGRISLQSPAITGQTLALAAAAPWDRPLRLEPAVPPVVFEIDGEDIGRRLLDAAQ